MSSSLLTIVKDDFRNAYNLITGESRTGNKDIKGLAIRGFSMAVGGYCAYKLWSISTTAIVVILTTAIAHDAYLWSAQRSYGFKESNYLDRTIFHFVVNFFKPKEGDVQYERTQAQANNAFSRRQH